MGPRKLPHQVLPEGWTISAIKDLLVEYGYLRITFHQDVTAYVRPGMGRTEYHFRGAAAARRARAFADATGGRYRAQDSGMHLVDVPLDGHRHLRAVNE